MADKSGVSKLSVKQKEEFQAAFDKFIDENGNIPNEKLRAIMILCKMDISDKELDLMIKEVDADASGEIDIDEFMAMMASHLGLDEPDEVKDAFKILDNDVELMVTVEDLRHIFVNMLKDKPSDETSKNIFLELDPLGTGKVNLHTFRKVFCF